MQILAHQTEEQGNRFKNSFTENSLVCFQNKQRLVLDEVPDGNTTSTGDFGCLFNVSLLPEMSRCSYRHGCL